MSDLRAKLLLYGGGFTLPVTGPAAILANGPGIIFPFTPTINYQHQTEYSQYELVHTNYPIQSFTRSRPGNIQITAPFHHQTKSDAVYTVGVMHFLRVCSKMDFGSGDIIAGTTPSQSVSGTPPPLLRFSAYGNINFNNVPVFIGSYSFSYPDDVDYVKFETSNIGTIKLPVTFTISIDLIPHYPPSKTLNQFSSLAKFASGDLYSDGFL